MRFEVLLCDICNSTFSSDLLPSPTETSQFIEVIRSNCEPPSYPRSVLSSAPAELARYDEEICRLQCILDEMQTARDALQSHYEACRSVFSAIHRLPSEILCGIFAFVPADVGGRFDTTEEAVNGAFAQVHLERIAGVCSRWHGLVMGTPALWCELSLNTAHLPSDAEERLIGLLKSVLDRGGDSPLTAHVVCRYLPKLLELFAQYSHRWRDLYLRIPSAEFGFLNSVRGHLPLLESLDIIGVRRSQGAMDIFKDAPRLTRLTLCGSSDSLSSFPLTQLQHLSCQVEASDLDAVLAVISDLPRTATCRLEIHVTSSDNEHPLGLSPVVANIHALVLAVIDPNPYHAGDVLGEIFDSLIIGVQKLTILTTLSTFHLRLHWPHLQSLAFFSRCSSLSHILKSLNIRDVIITEEDLIQCLSELSALEDLLISDHLRPRLVTDTFLHRLGWTSEPACIVPRLKSLTCRTFLEFDDNVFLAFVLSRLHPTTNSEGPFRVELVRLVPGSKLGAQVEQQLQELQTLGKFTFSFSDDGECDDDG